MGKDIKSNLKSFSELLLSHILISRCTVAWYAPSIDITFCQSGPLTVLGKIVTISEMYVIEIKPTPSETVYKDARLIQLEDIEKLDENERLDVILYDDDISNVIPGEVVEIVGNIVLQQKNNKNKMLTVVVNADSIKYINRKELVISSNDVKAFEKFACLCLRDCKDKNLITRLVSMFAPNVIEHDDVKLGLLRSIVGGDDHKQRGGGRVNTFLVGDPGTAKSTLGQEAAKIKPNSRHVSAPHASSKTITGIADKENERISLKLGAIPLSRNAICAIDEITAFQPDEQGRLLDVLEEGIIDIDKHGRHWTIPAPTTIVAPANPINSKWVDKQVASNDEINMIKTLLDRFQQIYAFRDGMEEEQINGFLSQISAIRKRKPHNYNYLAKYLIYATAIKVRKITPEAENMLNEFWKAAKLNGRLSMRMYGGLFSIAEAQAKLHLKDVIDEEIATQAMESVQRMMIQYGETIKTTTTPKSVTYKKFLEILQNSTVGIDIRELCKVACKEDKQIAAYLGNNWTLKNNRILQVVVGMLRNHSNIKEIKNKPMVLQWLGSVSDTCDICDGDTKSKNIVSYDERQSNQNENQSEAASHMSHMSHSNQKPPKIQATCPKCDTTGDAFYMNIHIANCEGTK